MTQRRRHASRGSGSGEPGGGFHRSGTRSPRRAHRSRGIADGAFNAASKSFFIRNINAPSASVLLLQALIVCCFLFGGSARPEVVTLPFLRAAAALLLGAGLLSLRLEQVRSHWPLFGLMAACIALPLAQLIPLPPGAANALPGHGIVAAIDAQANLGALWRPLTVTPEATRNALWSLLIPCAALVLAVQIPEERYKSIARLVLGMGLIAGVLGLLQILGDSNGPLYFYDTTNNGSAVGLFANRNHQAVFLACLLPLMFAAFDLRDSGGGEANPTRQHRLLARNVKQAIAASAALFLMLLIIVTGSRAGLAIGVLGFACTPFVVSGRSRSSDGASRRQARLALMLSCAVIGIVVALAVWMHRAVALDRLLSSDAAEEMRLRILPTVKTITQSFWPWGSGLGSFEKIYQVNEPADLLTSAYMNHAHNDWLELAMTGGLPALVLVLLAVVFWLAHAGKQAFSRGADRLSPLRKAGLIIVLLLALASFTDYPLRTPALSCLLALAAVWAALPAHETSAAIRRARS